jgi:hypothetical protein
VSFLSRYASSVVQKAHARVSAENADLVRLLIIRDGDVDRLTQERDELREQNAVLRERLSLIDREEDMREEATAKRRSDV